jgi:hypothetical protein
VIRFINVLNGEGKAGMEPLRGFIQSALLMLSGQRRNRPRDLGTNEMQRQEFINMAISKEFSGNVLSLI